MNWQRLAQLAGAVGLLFSAGLAGGAHAETATVRIAKQFGISYLPLTLMEDQKLFEKHAKQAGVDLKVEWLRFTAGSGMNEALLSGNLDFASGGVGPMLTIWGKTQNNLKVKGIAALNAMPLYLVSSNPNVKTIKDFTEKDKIALPGVKTSIQAVTLQMAAEKAFGTGQQYKLELAHGFDGPSRRAGCRAWRTLRDQRAFRLGTVPGHRTCRSAGAQGARQL